MILRRLIEERDRIQIVQTSSAAMLGDSQAASLNEGEAGDL